MMKAEFREAGRQALHYGPKAAKSGLEAAAVMVLVAGMTAIAIAGGA